MVNLRAKPLTSHLLKTSLLLACLIGLESCTGASETALRVGKNSPEQCSFQPDEGEPALMSNAGRVGIVASNYFGKSYNRYDLEAILGASGLETLRYAQAIDIRVFRVPYVGPEDRCLYLESVPLASEQVQEFWKSQTGGQVNNGRAGTIGLYGLYRDSETSTTFQQILVRTSTDRWTLVHEMLHANFHTARAHLGEKESYARDIAREQIEASDRMYTFAETRSETALLRLIESYDRLADLHLKDLANSSLEEVADESMLMDEYAAGRFKNVGQDAAISAAWYIKCSRERSLGDINTFADKVEATLLKPAREAGWVTAIDRASSILKKISDLNRRTLEIADRAKKISRASDSDLQCNSSNRQTAAGIAAKNAHLVSVVEMHPGLKAFKQALRDLDRTSSKILKNQKP